ncbi:aldehyde dehydrogenase family protein [Methylobacillus glycogenes]|uniref:aldehyde dehydrogenase family protein n=1 Tax=Methylobacillus glycogenes TaxID=406 RepID=UPI000AADD63B|nr:aldehyde dehydrogenase family protein [Methylobacillus glycogenes]
MSQYDLLINGKLTTADEYDAVINPATGETVGHAARASAAQVDLAVTSAKKAFPDWASDAALRSATLQRAADAVQAQSEELARLITLEQGRPLRDTRGEVAGAIGILRHYANFELPPFVPFKSDDSGLVVVERKPLGVVAAITPWNVPIILLLLKIIPALKAGNTVVAKPSEYTPLSTLLLGRLFAGIFCGGIEHSGGGGAGRFLAGQAFTSEQDYFHWQCGHRQVHLWPSLAGFKTHYPGIGRQ